MWEKSRERADLRRTWEGGCLCRAGSWRERKWEREVRSAGDWKQVRDWNFSKRWKCREALVQSPTA